MTCQEAIERLQEHKRFISLHGILTKKAIDIAIEALEKQIPKPYERDADEDPICPVCGELIWDMNYCDNCGQRIDTMWGMEL